MFLLMQANADANQLLCFSLMPEKISGPLYHIYTLNLNRLISASIISADMFVY